MADGPRLLRVNFYRLIGRGYTPLIAKSTNDAIRICRDSEESIDLLLTDVIMPHLNDRELCNQLKDIRPDLRVVYRSGYTADVIAKHGVLEADVFFIAKPFTVETLAVSVHEALTREE